MKPYLRLSRYGLFFALPAIIVLLTTYGGQAQSDETPTPVATEEAVPGVTGNMTGIISNGTATGTVPDGLPVVLNYGNETFTDSVRTTAGPDGAFVFEDVPIGDDTNYMAIVLYRDRPFFSEIVPGNADAGTLDLPVTIYELTEDPSVINITGTVIQLTADGGNLNVLQIIYFQNNSDRLFTSTQSMEEGRFASLTIPLPPGAVVLGFDTQERYTILPEQYAVVDVLPVYPETDHSVEIVYLIPYEGAAIIEQPLGYALEGEVRLLTTGDEITVNSDQLEPLGTESIGETEYESYGATLSLPAGDSIRFELLGELIGDETVNTTNTPDNSLSTVLGVIVLAGVLIGVAVLVRRRGGGNQRHIDLLIRQIAELDALHDSGQINHDVYQRQRAEYKARLEELTDSDR